MSEKTTMEADAAAALEVKRAANRAAFPAVTAIVDEFSKHFGPVSVKGGEEFATGKWFGWVRPPSPNCDSCTGHDGSPGCARMDRVAYGHDKPEPDKVFCGYRLARAPVVEEKKVRR